MHRSIIANQEKPRVETWITHQETHRFQVIKPPADVEKLVPLIFSSQNHCDTYCCMALIFKWIREKAPGIEPAGDLVP